MDRAPLSHVVVIKTCEIFSKKEENWMKRSIWAFFIFLVIYLFNMFWGNSRILTVKLLESILLNFCNPYFENINKKILLKST